MITVDMTVTITTIVAICSIVSPIITTALSNLHDTKIRKMKFKQDERIRIDMHIRDIYENYLKGVGSILLLKSDENAVQYGKYYPLALMHSPKEIQQRMMELHQRITEHKWDKARLLVDPLIIMMSEQTNT